MGGERVIVNMGVKKVIRQKHSSLIRLQQEAIM
jgi:hypothetical protein